MRIGIDIGGTTIGAGLESGGAIVRRTDGPSFPHDASYEQTIDILAGRISELLSDEVTGIGIGVPSVVDPERGIVYNTVNIPSWTEAHLKEDLEKRFGVPVYVDNDANCYALGAATALHCDKGIMLAMTLGTGVGSGIVVDGKLLRGRCCGAGELGSIRHREGTLEDYAASKFFTSQGTTARKVAEALEAGDAAAAEIFKEYGSNLADIVMVALYAYDPDILVFGGGIARAFKHFEKPLWQNLREKFDYQANLDGLRITAYTDADAALLGAAALA